MIEVPYTKNAIELRGEKKRVKTYYSPYITLTITRRGSVFTTPCLVDSGAVLNVFPMDIALFPLEVKKRYIRKRSEICKFQGISSTESVGYRLNCDLYHLKFGFDNVPIYFMEDQTIPLLGRVGFMDKFQRIIFDEEKKKLQLFLKN